MSASIRVPYSNVQNCHDDLRRDAAFLWNGFETRLVPAANQAQPPLERLDAVLRLKDEVWAEYLTEHGGNPRVAEGPWRCAVGDLALALCMQAIEAVPNGTGTAEDKRAELSAIEQAVAQKLSWTTHGALLTNQIRTVEAQLK